MTMLDLEFADDGWSQVFVGVDEKEGRMDESDFVIGLKELFESLIFLRKRN